MTREKEIEQAMKESVTETIYASGWGMTPQVTDLLECAFTKGAKWADETIIEKACEWIEQYLFDLGYPDDWCRDSPNIESGKERFIKAMKGE